MGKDTGFLDYKRTGNLTVPPEIRIKSFDEFHTMLSMRDRTEQGGRCMNCGVPFCQSGMVLGGMRTGCPLNNLIPEWNDEIWNGNWEHALSRLLKTNNFPEFTGRVCPALCECACTCGYNGEAVTVHDNELAIIEYGFANNLVPAQPPAVRSDKTVAIIGSGPSGLAVADRLNMRGHSCTVYEKSDRAGGLLMYGIPNMKLDKRIVERRIELMKKQGVKFVTGCNINTKAKMKKLTEEYDAVVICVGSGKPRAIFKDEVKAEGVYYAVDFLKSTTKSLLDCGLEDGTYISAKDKHVVIVGGGDTGNDCVGTSIRHGAKSVTQLEMMPEPPSVRAENNPWPEYPRVKKVDYGQEEAIYKFGHDPRVYTTTVKEIQTDENGKITSVVTVKLNGFNPVEGSEEILPCDLLIVAAGFVGLPEKDAAAFGVGLTQRNVINVDDYKTDVPGVFACGDCKNGQSLVVVAIADARDCARAVDEWLLCD